MSQQAPSPAGQTLSPRQRPKSRPISIITTASGDEEVLSGRKWAHTVDEPWDPLILTLDGGGIRGYSSLLILQRLMQEISEWEKKLEQEEGVIPGALPRTFNPDELLPCHYFDFIYGTSTGGLIATMIGRLRMSVPQCLSVYRKVGNDLFGKRRSVVPLATKYDHKPLEDAVKEIVQTHCKTHPPGECTGDDWYPWNLEMGREEDEIWQPDFAEDRICQSVCLTATHTGKIDEAHLLRTYNHQYNTRVALPGWIPNYNQGADKLKIWEVTRATSAAPFYFKTLQAMVKGKPTDYKDGGIRENNPAGAAWDEYISMYGDAKDPALLLSVGTGKPNEQNDGFASTWPGPLGQFKLMKAASEKFAVFKNLLVKYTEGEEKHRTMLAVAKGENRWYKRLNVSKGLETMKLDNWERGPWKDPETNVETVVPGGNSLTRMQQVTWDYLDRELERSHDTYAPPKVMLNQAAEKLVRHRRERERTKDEDPRRWEVFMGRWLTGRLGPEDTVMHPPPEQPRRRRRS